MTFIGSFPHSAITLGNKTAAEQTRDLPGGMNIDAPSYKTATETYTTHLEDCANFTSTTVSTVTTDHTSIFLFVHSAVNTGSYARKYLYTICSNLLYALEYEYM